MASSRPVSLPANLGCQLLQRLVEKNGTADPVRQHYIVQNVRKGFYDPHKSRSRVAWKDDTNFHLGYHPLTLEALVRNENFQGVLDSIAFKAYNKLRGKLFSYQPEHIHVLFWCNHGFHRSVGFCRLLQVAANVWGWERLSCNYFVLFFLYLILFSSVCTVLCCS